MNVIVETAVTAGAIAAAWISAKSADTKQQEVTKAFQEIDRLVNETAELKTNVVTAESRAEDLDKKLQISTKRIGNYKRQNGALKMELGDALGQLLRVSNTAQDAKDELREQLQKARSDGLSYKRRAEIAEEVASEALSKETEASRREKELRKTVGQLYVEIDNLKGTVDKLSTDNFDLRDKTKKWDDLQRSVCLLREKNWRLEFERAGWENTLQNLIVKNMVLLRQLTKRAGADEVAERNSNDDQGDDCDVAGQDDKVEHSADREEHKEELVDPSNGCGATDQQPDFGKTEEAIKECEDNHKDEENGADHGEGTTDAVRTSDFAPCQQSQLDNHTSDNHPSEYFTINTQSLLTSTIPILEECTEDPIAVGSDQEALNTESQKLAVEVLSPTLVSSQALGVIDNPPPSPVKALSATVDLVNTSTHEEENNVDADVIADGDELKPLSTDDTTNEAMSSALCTNAMPVAQEKIDEMVAETTLALQHSAVWSVQVNDGDQLTAVDNPITASNCTQITSNTDRYPSHSATSHQDQPGNAHVDYPTRCLTPRTESAQAINANNFQYNALGYNDLMVAQHAFQSQYIHQQPYPSNGINPTFENASPLLFLGAENNLNSIQSELQNPHLNVNLPGVCYEQPSRFYPGSAPLFDINNPIHANVLASNGNVSISEPAIVPIPSEIVTGSSVTAATPTESFAAYSSHELSTSALQNAPVPNQNLSCSDLNVGVESLDESSQSPNVTVPENTMESIIPEGAPLTERNFALNIIRAPPELQILPCFDLTERKKQYDKLKAYRIESSICQKANCQPLYTTLMFGCLRDITKASFGTKHCQVLELLEEERDRFSQFALSQGTHIPGPVDEEMEGPVEQQSPNDLAEPQTTSPLTPVDNVCSEEPEATSIPNLVESILMIPLRRANSPPTQHKRSRSNNPTEDAVETADPIESKPSSPSASYKRTRHEEVPVIIPTEGPKSTQVISPVVNIVANPLPNVSYTPPTQRKRSRSNNPTEDAVETADPIESTSSSPSVSYKRRRRQVVPVIIVSAEPERAHVISPAVNIVAKRLRNESANIAIANTNNNSGPIDTDNLRRKRTNDDEESEEETEVSSATDLDNAGKRRRTDLSRDNNASTLQGNDVSLEHGPVAKANGIVSSVFKSVSSFVGSLISKK
ncbi:hypothetical protein HDU76_009192 [Blyttiomyces sp. JEL0837]|nr:hypothetical protein HDU76_009192 [Blyttiomyces sp. JEL0837]